MTVLSLAVAVLVVVDIWDVIVDGVLVEVGRVTGHDHIFRQRLLQASSGILFSQTRNGFK